MTTKEKIKVMQHYEDGGDVEIRASGSGAWSKWDCDEPNWNWGPVDYRIKPKPVELLWEWWFYNEGDEHITIGGNFRTEEYSKEFNNRYYGKTGRWFNPETKEFGTDK